MSPSRRPLTLVSEFVNQSPLQNTCEATDGLTLFRVTSCVDSVHKNQYTNDEFFTASQATSRFDGITARRLFLFEPGPASWKHAPTPERCSRQEPHGRKWPSALTLCYKVSGPFRAPSAL